MMGTSEEKDRKRSVFFGRFVWREEGDEGDAASTFKEDAELELR